MPTIESFDDLLRGLEAHPEWRERLRQVVLTDRLLALPDIVAELAEAQRRTEEAVAGLTAQVSKLATRVDDVVGYFTERRYLDKAHAYFAPIVRRLHVLSSDELDDLLEAAVDAGQVTRPQARDIRLADGVMRGRRDGQVVYLVLEASSLVDDHDVHRAAERAELLAATGLATVPVVAGTQLIPSARRLAQERGVWQVTNGHTIEPGSESV